MKQFSIFALVACLFACCSTDKTEFAAIEPVPFTDVHFDDSFWLPRMEINRRVSIPSAFHQCEINGRMDNFAIAGGLKQGEHRGDFSFDDTDVYKIIEGAAYSLAVKYDAHLDTYLDSVIALIAAAQEDDGYLTTCVTNKCARLSGWWGTHRWEKINSHELYNSGHLYEAAVAHFQATGKRSLLDVALKNADLICRTFGLDSAQIHYPSGHPIIEMALVKLYRVSGEQKYLDEARYFVDEAGRLSNGRQPGIYSQDHTPVLQQTEIVGHAVRAGYFYSGVTDVAALQHDVALFEAVKRIWNNMAGKKLYLNGGIGSRAQGEGFGPEYELNNFTNYCETCASIANVYWCHRMFLATGDARYIDVLERTLYNGVIAGVSLSGDRFFYDNPMASLGGHQRAPWFGCACCPGNVTRFMASVPLYNYATEKRTVYVNLYVQGDAKIALEGDTLSLAQTTKYPWDGDVKLKLTNISTPKKLKLMLRIPSWANGEPVPSDLYHYVDNQKNTIFISVNGKKQKIKAEKGYAVLERKWQSGDEVALHFDMPVRRVAANENVCYDKGLLAMERGPVLYALESADQPTPWLFDMIVPPTAKIDARFEKELLGGVVTLSGQALKNGQPTPFKAIPYAVWNNRGAGQLMVWTPENEQSIIPEPKPSIASRAVGGWGMNDGIDPKSSADLNSPYQYWWLKKGTQESVEYRFSKPETVSAVEVYWLAFDHYDVSYRAPQSWKLFYRNGSRWTEITSADEFGTALDRYNRVTFKPVTATGLKITAQLQDGFSGGVLEWKVE
ncbi:MAG: glycoside hydrolase family 127 protein [Candidatus Symbiothrix sp.]|jgi:DUF1680 family protein|nr:glycoside hydrolase family 127 protein [Candidatus Symbiothrix sp.]